MSNNTATIQSAAKKILKMAAAELKENLQFFKTAEKIEMAAWNKNPEGFKPGQTVGVLIPDVGTIQEDNLDITNYSADIQERIVNTSLNLSATTALTLTSNELATDVDIGMIYKRFVQPRIPTMAASIESRVIALAAQNTGNLVGTPGAGVVDVDTLSAANELLSDGLAPISDKDRYYLFDARQNRAAINSIKNLFTFPESGFDDGSLRGGYALGMNWGENQLSYTQTNGNSVSGLTVEANATEGSTSLTLAGLTASTGTFTTGTTFTIAGVNNVHPLTKTDLGTLKRFSHVGATQTANASGYVTLTLNEPLYTSTSGSLQNITALPAATDVVTVDGAASTSYRQSLLYHKEAFRVCTVPLQMPKASTVDFAEQVNEDGINISIIRAYDQKTRSFITRMDLLGAFLSVRPAWACRITT
ncbi:MAG: hypothetical protein KGL39_45180 [Patescibacteria group bacterium]|nr:hypothetical protein [Patescibacteria group bacterium]